MTLVEKLKEYIKLHSDWIPIYENRRPITNDGESEDILFLLKDGTIEKGIYCSGDKPTWEANYSFYPETCIMAWRPLSKLNERE